MSSHEQEPIYLNGEPASQIDLHTLTVLAEATLNGEPRTVTREYTVRSPKGSELKIGSHRVTDLTDEYGQQQRDRTHVVCSINDPENEGLFVFEYSDTTPLVRPAWAETVYGQTILAVIEDLGEHTLLSTDEKDVLGVAKDIIEFDNSIARGLHADNFERRIAAFCWRLPTIQSLVSAIDRRSQEETHLKYDYDYVNVNGNTSVYTSEQQTYLRGAKDEVVNKLDPVLKVELVDMASGDAEVVMRDVFGAFTSFLRQKHERDDQALERQLIFEKAQFRSRQPGKQIVNDMIENLTDAVIKKNVPLL